MQTTDNKLAGISISIALKSTTAVGALLGGTLLFSGIPSFGAGEGEATDGNGPGESAPVIEERIVIDRIWPAVSVGFCLLTHEDRQYVAYYNAERRMTVAARELSEDEFTRKILPSKSDKPPRQAGPSTTIQGWDSHNYITMAIDSAGHIHLAGNMHVDPLTYFRSREPRDITTLEQVDAMVGRDENRCTYPKFMTGPGGGLIFHYRDGSSGNGVEVYNVYDTKTRRWQRLLDSPLISGRGKSNAYMRGPRKGPDGWYHLLWMWRNTPDVATNHDLSCARSRDLVHWESVAGKELELPITPADRETIIDPVPVNGGLHNSNHHFGFDSKERLVATYFKHDGNGDTQAYAARFDEGTWRIRRISDWEGRHIFKGGGSGPSTFGTSLSVKAPRQHGPGVLAVPFHHWKAGSGLLVIDEETLDPLRVEPQTAQPGFPPSLAKPHSDFPGMRVHWRGDSGSSPDPKSRYALRWETLGSNRDRPRKPPLPESGELVLYRLRDK